MAEDRALQISPIPSLDDETNLIRQRTAEIVADQIIPSENTLRYGRLEKRAEAFHRLQNLVKQAGLWAPHLPKEYGGMGIGFLKHAYMNEILAWSSLRDPRREAPGRRS